MAEKSVLVTVNVDMEAREAAFFVQSANKFKSKLQLIIDDNIVNAKSIMGVISVGMQTGDLISLTAEGEDASEALEALAKLLSKEE